MKHLGDITQIDGHTVPPVNIVCGGSPCQDLSVAGKRKGLQGERSGLFMEQIRIIKEMRDECKKRLSMQGAAVTVRDIMPRYMVWENVPGAFSSNKGEDFRCVLEETAKVNCESASIPRPQGGRWTPSGCILGDGWSIAWRVHDAQFWGVPQRRKRISLVADFGGESAPDILFEKIRAIEPSLSGNIEESREERQGTSTDTERSVDKAISFQERAGKPGGGKGILIQNERTGALSTFNNQSVCYGLCSMNSNSMKSSNPHSGIYEADTSRTLDLNGGNPACNQGGMIVLEGNGQRESHKGDGYKESDVMYTLNTVEQHGVVYSIGHDERSAQFTTDEKTDPLTASDYKDPIKVLSIGNRQLNQISMNEKSNTLDTRHDQQAVLTYQDTVGALCARDYKGIDSQYVEEDKCITQSVVRRLMPLECERLQGFPDHWTDIGEWTDTKGKKHKDADSPRYKALGNSIALPFWEWMAKRMVEVLKSDGQEHPTMASLFDGIGGFPLVYSRAGCEPIWGSEIEEFPIAVTKIRFPE